MSLSALRSQLPEARRRTSDRSLPIPYRAVGPLLLACDVVIILLLSLFCGIAYHHAALGNTGDAASFMRLGAVAAFFFTASLHVRGLYKPSSILAGARQVRPVLVAWTAVFALLVCIAFLMKMSDGVSRGYVLVFFLGGSVALPLWRLAAAAMLGRAIAGGLVHGERVLLIGQAEELADDELLDDLRLSGREVWDTLPVPFCARFDDELQRILPRLVDAVRQHGLSEILIAASWAHLPQTEEIGRALHVVPLPVRLLPDKQVRRVLRRQDRGGIEYALELKRAPLTLAEQAAKRCLDLVVASTTLLLLAPLFITAALGIRLDTRGPVLFRQQRVGFNGRIFRIYKFRTMTAMDDGPVVRQATADDIRVTRVGRWLRRTSIDELPQLFNVITGDMSLVGPRPHAAAHDSEYDAQIGNYALRHHVKPGITGCAQVSGHRGETATLELMRARVERDLWYIDNWSLGLDLKVMFATIREVTRGHNAY